MDQVHLHLMLSHLPLAGVAIGFIILVAGMIMKNAMVQRTAFGIFLLSALFAVPVYFTGEGAEHTAEEIPGIDENYIETHEDLAGIYIWVIGALGLLSALAMIAFRKAKMNSVMINIIILTGAIATLAVSVRLGATGGEIRHTEIRTGTGQNPISSEEIVYDRDF